MPLIVILTPTLRGARLGSYEGRMGLFWGEFYKLFWNLVPSHVTFRVSAPSHVTFRVSAASYVAFRVKAPSCGT
jgi:hypothetical protein